MSDLFSSLGIEWKMLIAQIINFGILVFILTKLVYKPLIKALDDREKTIKKISDDSSSMEKILQDAEVKKEEILKEARLSSEKIIKDSEASVGILKKNILDEAKKDAEKIIKDGQKRLEEEQQRFYSGLKSELVSLVSLGIEQTVGKYITKDAEAKLKEEAIDVALSLKK